MFETWIVRELSWRQYRSESQGSIVLLCRSTVLPVSQQLCTACYRQIKHRLFSEKIALSPKWKLAIREGLQLNDRTLVLESFSGSFYQVLKICASQSEDCSRLSLLQHSSGYDNCHPQPWSVWPGAISLLLESFFSLTLPSKHRPFCF